MLPNSHESSCIRPFCIILALDSQLSQEARCRWTINDTLKMVVMRDIDIYPDASMVAYVVKSPIFWDGRKTASACTFGRVYVSGVEGFKPVRVSSFNGALPLLVLGKTEITERAVSGEMVLYPRGGHEPQGPKLLIDIMSPQPGVVQRFAKS